MVYCQIGYIEKRLLHSRRGGANDSSDFVQHCVVRSLVLCLSGTSEKSCKKDPNGDGLPFCNRTEAGTI